MLSAYHNSKTTCFCQDEANSRHSDILLNHTKVWGDKISLTTLHFISMLYKSRRVSGHVCVCHDIDCDSLLYNLSIKICKNGYIGGCDIYKSKICDNELEMFALHFTTNNHSWVIHQIRDTHACAIVGECHPVQ